MIMVKKTRFSIVFYTAICALYFLFSFSVSADVIDQQETFFVNATFDKYARASLKATLQHISNRLYVYVEEPYWNGLDSSQRNSMMRAMSLLTNEFENNIYPKETSLWGSEPNPGIDGDSRITILLEELIKGNGGYFDTSHGYARQQVTGSNQREMIFLNAESLSLDVNLVKVFLAHEFHHLISFNQKELLRNISEDIWLNELRAEYSASLIGYNTPYASSNLERRVRVFLDNPSDSLTEWPNKPPDYAIAEVFGEYLVEQYGDSILSETLKSSSVSINSLNQFLQRKNYYERFGKVFLNWMTAAYVNDISKNSGFGYRRNELKGIKVQPQQRVYLSGGFSEYSINYAIKDWQPVWLEFNLDILSADLSKSGKLDVSGDFGQQFLVSYLAFYTDGSVELGAVPLSNSSGTAYILHADKKLYKVVVLATKATKIFDFGSAEAPNTLSVKFSLADTKSMEAKIVRDGSLIRKFGEKEIYVVWGRYKRYLTPGVIALYGHLNPVNAIEVEPGVFHSYITSNYVKYVNDEKVYAVWPDDSRHWLHITPQQWDASGRDWGAIFTINELELNYYKTGDEIIH